MTVRIPNELREFIEAGVTILVGTRDARMRPECVRGVGVRFGAGGKNLTVFLPVATSERTLRNIGENGAIAACFTAMDHRSTQLKGRVVSVRTASAKDLELVDRYVETIAKVLGSVGVPPRFVVRMNRRPCKAVRFEVASVFVQTPGPGAGEPMSEAVGGGGAAS